ncbi:MAG: RIP metalloprotease RseP [Endomicrobiales bacterium]
MINIFGLQITIFQVLATVFGVGLLVFIHELGHFLMAKKFRIRVEKFTFGFGPELVGFTYGETRYSLCAIPLGGMVKMPGEDIDNSTGSPDEFLSQPWYRRLLIAFSGPFMNYLLAIALFTVVISHWGIPKPSPEPVIGEVMAGYPAQAAGLKSGDLVLKVNGTPVKGWAEMAETIHRYPDRGVELEVRRDGKEFSVSVTPKKDTATGLGLIGIGPKTEIEKVGLVSSVGLSTKMVVFQSVFTLKYLGEKIVRWEKPEVAGPIGVVQILAKAARAGWETLLHLLAVISVALGLFNLLPIPLVDGGHIFLSIIEGITRRPLNKKVIQVSNLVGLGIIVSIFVFATYSDIARIGASYGSVAPK